MVRRNLLAKGKSNIHVLNNAESTFVRSKIESTCEHEFFIFWISKRLSRIVNTSLYDPLPFWIRLQGQHAIYVKYVWTDCAEFSSSHKLAYSSISGFLNGGCRGKKVAAAAFFSFLQTKQMIYCLQDATRNTPFNVKRWLWTFPHNEWLLEEK